MLGMVNSHPLNGAALASWVKAATVAASVALTATVDATRVRGGAASFTGSATVSASAIRVFPAASTATSQAQGSVYPWYQAAGEAVLVGRATALAACKRIVHAEAYGTTTVTGSAIAESEIGEVIAAADFTIEAEATRNRPGLAILTAGAAIDPPAVVFGQTVNLLAISTARAEASVKLSGEGFWRHDGYVEADATGVLSPQVTWSVLSVPLGMGFTIEAEATRQRPATASMAVSCLGTAEGLAGVPGEVDATARATSEVNGTRVHGAQVAGSASAAYRIAVAPSQGHAATAVATASLLGSGAPSQTFAGRVTASAQASGSVTGTRAKPGAATATARLTAIVGSGINYPGTADATAGATAIAVEPATQHYAEAVATATTLEISAVQARSYPSLAFLYATGHVTLAGVAVEVGAVSATASALLAEAAPATSHKGTVLAALVAQGTAQGDRVMLASVNALVGATGRAFGLRRGDLNAPPERSMILSYEPRGMIVPEAERTLWVPA